MELSGEKIELQIKPSSVVHNLSVWNKILFLLAVSPYAALSADIVVLLVLMFSIFLIIIISNLELQEIWYSGRLYLCSIVVSVLVISFFFVKGDIQERFMTGVIYSARFALVIISAVIFLLVTNPMELPHALMRIGVPHRFGIVLMVAIRLLPLISEKFLKIAEAQKLRGGGLSLSLRSLLTLPQHLASFVVPAVFVSLEVAVALADTLLSRGYDPKRSITLPPNKKNTFDYIFALSALFIFILSYSFQP